MNEATRRAAEDPPPARRRRLGTWWLWGLVVLVLGSLWAAWAAARQEAGTRWLLGHVPGLTVSGVRGTLFGDTLSVDSLQWQGTPQQPSVRVERLEWSQPQWRWLPHAGAWVGLSLERLHANRVVWQAPASPEPAGAAPAHLRLPFALSIAALQVDELQVDPRLSLRGLQAHVLLGARQGGEHLIDGLTVQLDRARLQGSARIETDAPLALTLDLGATATTGTPWTATLQASGQLAKFDAKARMRGEAAGNTPAPMLDAQAQIEPFAGWPLAALEFSTQELDLAALASAAPRTRIRARAQVRSAGLDQPASASIQLDNLLPGRLDTQRLPLRQMQIELGGTPSRLERIDIGRVDAQLADERGPAGRLHGRGAWQGTRLSLQLQASSLQPARLDGRAGALDLSGPLSIELDGLPAPTGRATAAPLEPWRARVEGELTGTLGASRTQVRTELGVNLSAGTVEVSRLLARSGDASASARIKAQRNSDAGRAGWQIVGQGELARFDPLPWWPGAAGSAWARGPHRLDGRWQVDLRWPDTMTALLQRDAAAAAVAVQGHARVEWADSLLAGVPVSGQLELTSDASRLKVELHAVAAGNRLDVTGQVAGTAADDRWQVTAAAPTLAALQPLLNLAPAQWSPQSWALRGDAQLTAQVGGRWPALSSQGRLQTKALQWRQSRVGSGDVQWSFDPGAAGALTLQATLADWQHGEQRIDSLTARADGTQREHRLNLQLDTPLRPPGWSENLLGSTSGGMRVSLEGQGQWLADTDGTSTWRAQPAWLRVGSRQGNGPAWIDARSLQGSVVFDRQALPRRAQLEPGRVLLPGGAALRWTEASWQAGDQGPDRFDLRGELEPLAVAAVLARLQPDIGWAGDLTLAGRIEMHAAERFDADVVLERAAGDLRIADEIGTPQALGLSELRLVFAAHDGVWQFAQGAAGRQLGEMAGSQVMRTDARSRWPAHDSPLEGVLEMRVANLGAWGVWVPPGWRLGGNLQVSGALGGRFGAPEVRGSLRGSGLSVRNALQGVGLSDGELAATLDGAVARVQRFEFKGGDGTLRMTGEATLGDTPSARLQVRAERFRLLGRIDRRLVASGRADLDLSREALHLDGRFVLDEGLFDFSRGDAPSLDGDVRVVRAANGEAAAAAERAARPLPAPLRNAQIALAIDLGEKLVVRGRGLDATLRGELKLSTPGGRLAVNGAVRTASGTYLAYAQKMSIERGELFFTGSAENPRLDIVAVRPNLDVRVGVAVTGPLANPRVRLFSEPEMTEMDKLSWLVLGRASDGLGRTDTALLQRAAVALLAGERAAPTDALLGQLGISDFSLRQSEGEVRETIVSLGRQLSQRWYVGYERSVNATTGTWQLIYRVAQRFTLRAQSGVENSLDVIWSWRWD